jgi:hypothetical protein
LRWIRNSPNADARYRFVKGRLAFYGGIVVVAVLSVAYATAMPGKSYSGSPPAPSSEEATLSTALHEHVSALSEVIGERRVGKGDSLTRAKAYLLDTVREISSTHDAHVHLEDVGPDGYHAENVIFEVPGVTTNLVVIGAHYDSAMGAPGADDNATGVAVTLELMRRFSPQRPKKTLRFVLFANEEAPYFQNAGMGSLTHAQGCRRRGEQLRWASRTSSRSSRVETERSPSRVAGGRELGENAPRFRGVPSPRRPC